MLKIKDNVDLKELEKFGFKFNKTFGEYQMFSPSRYEKIVIVDDKHILIEDFSGFSMVEYLDILFDLIKADLVEKVEESNDT